MARMTWAEMKTEAVFELRNRGDIGTRLERWLRNAYMEVAYGYRFYELETSTTFTLSVGASEITFMQIGKSDIKYILSLRDTSNNRKINPASFRYIDKRTIADGDPAHYCRYGTSFLFDAKPASSGNTYKLRYRKQVTEPDFSASASPETPDNWDEIIMLMAVARGHHALFEPALAEQTEARAMRLVAKFPLEDVIDSEDQDFGITPRV